MNITNIHFTDAETAALYALAGQALKEQGKSRKEAKEICGMLTPANLVRLALGFKARGRGGARLGAGKWAKYCVECTRLRRLNPDGSRVEVWSEAPEARLCRECWQAAADGRAAGIRQSIEY